MVVRMALGLEITMAVMVPQMAIITLSKNEIATLFGKVTTLVSETISNSKGIANSKHMVIILHLTFSNR